MLDLDAGNHESTLLIFSTATVLALNRTKNLVRFCSQILPDSDSCSIPFTNRSRVLRDSGDIKNHEVSLGSLGLIPSSLVASFSIIAVVGELIVPSDIV